MTTAYVETSVCERYSSAAQAPEAALCCPIDYDPRYLEMIPDEIIEKDYGCGDPSQHVRPGDTVLDLGSGGGKICYIAAQVTGPDGRVIGVDMNDDMLALAHKYREEMASRMGYANVEFRKGKIQDLALDRNRLDAWLGEHPVTDEHSLRALEEYTDALRRDEPMIASDSVDLVVSNCVLNLVSDGEKKQLFQEIYRVLKSGGRAAISDIVADEPVPAHLKENSELWSGCLSGAMQEAEFVQAFAEAGFYGIEIAKRDETPWQTVEGIEFRSVTLVAYKGKEGDCWDHGEALIYKGPFRKVTDDDGHTFTRGQRIAVCRKTFDIYSREPYTQYFEHVEPLSPVDIPRPFPCNGGMQLRNPRETKGEGYDLTTETSEACCGPEGSC
ncbi:MAG: methyltransferase domain-containing protein [Gemmatimonadetes bacterium]|jgi:arsenite methyltransferase|nr:methyltransferase domain-containing protein [Gemmatimonadota bacterium]